MRILREGLSGEDVRIWQLFLASQGISVGAADGIFGPNSSRATREFQKRHLLIADGIVGAQSLRKAMELGFDPTEWPGEDVPTNDPYFPRRPTHLGALTIPKAESLYGAFKWRKAATADEKRAIRILDGWDDRNIVTAEIPQLARIAKPTSTRREMHRLAVVKMQKLWDAWEKAGLLKYVLKFDGLYNPRVIGGTSTLSNHAFGAAFDINEPWNEWGGQPAPVGQKGSVRLLVPIANSLGFYWGGHYQGKKDGMHFELVEP